MTPPKLKKLQGLGGKVVEIVLNNKRRATGFLVSADSERIILTRRDDYKGLMTSTYRTSQTSDYFTELEEGEAVNYDHNPPKPGIRVIMRLSNSSRVCGYATKPRPSGNVELACELLDDTRHRSHHHHHEFIESSHILKPAQS